MYRRKIYRFYIAAFMLLSILLSGCGKTTPNGSGTSESTIAEMTETIHMPEPVYEFTVMVSENRGLTISLHLEELEDFSAKEIRKIQIYDGDQLLQTITKDDVPEVTDYVWDGLFFNESNKVGLPDVRDLNFDGAEDFGLLAVSTYPHNVPYCYFLWNDVTEQFEYRFMAFGMDALEVDENEKCLIETSLAGAIIYVRYYSFESDGSMNIRVETRNAATN